MTIEERLEQLELQNQRIERKNKRLTAALTLMAVVMCAMVAVAAKGVEGIVDDFFMVRAEMVTTKLMSVNNLKGDEVISFGADDEGNGNIVIKSATGEDRIFFGHDELNSGGMITIHNKTGEGIAQMRTDEYGNGVVGAYNRKGIGSVVSPRVILDTP